MGLDIYVGSLSRYYLGDWHSVVAQAARAEGIQFSTARPEAPESPGDPADLEEAVAAWQSALGEALGLKDLWADRANAPYATDQPHWLGYGALVLLAAHLERPDLADPSDTPQEFASSTAVEAVKAAGSDLYPSLIGGAEWWLPAPGVSATFTGTTVDGETVAMATLDLLERELDHLRERLGIDGAALTEALLTGGPDPDSADQDPKGFRDGWVVFGLAVFLELTRQAQRMQLPLLLDY
ncbi:hypothetical protein SAMN02745244_01216 [Tessaracoccus bendigoensis DSM 12906]|uniref:Uncharacterized protein n=1 Tax=Tessaracoccus bendigoensis DSM 12906 TaxID=1123357 RepID=A0A1M6EK28_9ACTN|nr:hypothetical protein [Tessaracoccus bendigoensis]SHI85872.1 hypothetical protein SAMN02745244_01216 [Tessaracoccus bendigoensis DSM 12906]